MKVVVEGLAPSANVASSVAKGEYLILSATGGRLAAQETIPFAVDGGSNITTTATSVNVDVGGAVGAVKCAIALEAESSNAADVWVLKSY